MSHWPAGPAQPPLENVALTNRLDPLWLQAPTSTFTLGPGDRLELELIGEPASRVITPVAPDGKLYFNLLPGVDVWGLTLPQAKQQLEGQYTNLLRQPPQISLVLREVQSKRVWILGRVQTPGVYPLASPTTLLEALSLAGGTMTLTSYRDQEAAGINEDTADLRRSFVLRDGHWLPVDFDRLFKEGDLSQNIYLQPDDFIYLPAAQAREVYVLGAVNLPRPVPFREGMTVATAIASANGTLSGAYLSHVAVVRGSLTHPQIAILNYKRLIRGEERDIPLHSADIVYVPFSPYRYLTHYVQVILETFVSSTAINAGSRAIGQSSGGTGVYIPVGSGSSTTTTTPATH